MAEMKTNIDIVTKALGVDQDLPLKQRLGRYWNSAEGARKEVDWRWFNYDLWVSGNHYAKWDKNTQQITTSPKADGKPKVVINKVYTTLRSVRSYVLQNQPKADVVPDDLTPDNVSQAAETNQFLSYLHDYLHLGQSLRATMWHALKYSVGWWQIVWDETAEDSQGQIKINVVDPYDLYIDPTARIPSEARYMILAVVRNLEDLKEDPKYKDVNWDEIQGTGLLAASPLKARLMQYERGQRIWDNKEKEERSAIVKEYWYKESSDEEVEMDDPENDGKTKKVKQSKTKIMLCTMIGDTIIRKPLDTGLDRFPFFRLCSDIEPLQMYGTGWVKNLIPLNRLLERLESSLAEYNDLINKGKYMAPKNAGVRVINNEHGQIIEHKPGMPVEAAPLPPMNAIIMEQITNVNRYIEDIGCMHDASLGRIPSGAKSGISIETLMEGDSNNLSELNENTEEFLEDVYAYILYLVSQKYQFARNIITTTTTGEKKWITVIGADADGEMQQGQNPNGQPSLVIGAKNAVRVTIDSWLAYTNDGRQDAVAKLGQIMNQNGYQLPADFILEAFETGNVADVVKKMQDQQKMQQEQQTQQQQQQMQMQQQGKVQMQQMQQAQQEKMAQTQQEASQPPVAGQQQAIAFIRQLLNGQMPQIPAPVGPDFINYLDQFMHSPEGQQQGGEFLSVLQQLRDKAMLEMQQGQSGQVSQQ